MGRSWFHKNGFLYNLRPFDCKIGNVSIYIEIYFQNLPIICNLRILKIYRRGPKSVISALVVQEGAAVECTDTYVGSLLHDPRSYVSFQVFRVEPLDQEYIDSTHLIFLLSFSFFIQQLLMILTNLSGKFKLNAMI